MSEQVETTPKPDASSSPDLDNALDSIKISDPLPASKLMISMNLEDKIITSVGPQATIDVQPDFVDIVIQLVDHSVRIFEYFKSRNIPTMTPASLVAVFLQQIYGYGALSDIYMLREYPSRHSRIFTSHEMFRQYVNIISWMATPPFLKDILRGLLPTPDPRRKNLIFIYSFAAYRFYHDFGRTFPIHMFIALHNIIAESGPKATDQEIWHKWLKYVVIQQNTGETYCVANLIGGAYGDHEVDNRLTLKLRTLLSVTTLATQQRQVIYRPFPLQPYIVAQFSETNPYEYLLGAEDTLFPTIIQFTNSLDATLKELFKGTVCLGNLFGLESGCNIMNHYYCEPQIPTFHTMSVTLDPKKTTTTSLNAFAERIKFRCTYRCETDSLRPLRQLPQGTAFERELYLVNDPVAPDPSPEGQVPIVIQPPDPDLRKPVFSRIDDEIVLYSPYSNGKSAMYYPITNGLHIETYEIDSFHVPMVKLDNSITDENNYFLESAIPIESTVSAESYDGTRNLSVRYRTITDESTTRNAFSYFDRTKHTLPVYPQTVQTDSTTSLLPGFSPTLGITHPNQATTKIAYGIKERLEPEEGSGVSPTELFAWSSYRWIDPMYAQTPFAPYNTYFICDLRTMYGTLPQTTKSRRLDRLIE